MKSGFIFLIIAFLLPGIFWPSKRVIAGRAEPSGFWLLYSGNTFGELKPCGCAREEDQGGVERRQAYFKSIRTRSEDVITLDTGDNFKEPSRQGKIKARFLARSMNRMAYDAVALGDKDLVYGQEFLKSLEAIPWVATNMTLEDAPSMPKYRIKNLSNGTRVAILALSGPERFYSGPKTGLRIEDPLKALKTILPSLIEKERPDLTIALTHMKRKKALSLLDEDGLDIVVNGHIEKETDEIDMKPVQRSGKLFVQAGPRGQKIGEVFVERKPGGKLSFRHQMVKLDSRIQFDPEMVKLYKEYNGEIEKIFFETLSERRNKKRKKVYATDKTCRKCHAEAHEIWKKSRHGRAFATLQKINKGFDPECLVCHTVGFNQPGGFVSENDSPDLENVQCETCHGSGLEHSKKPQSGWDENAASACVKCHVKNHSPKFKFSEYWPRIKH